VAYLSKTINKHQFLIRQFLKFAVVGSLGTLIDFGLLNLFVKVFRFDVYFSATLSFIAAVINNFLLNKYWTFKIAQAQDEGKGRRQFVQFSLVSVIGLAINLLIMYVLIQYASLWYNWAKVAATVVVLVWNFWANKLWTFKEKTSQG